MRRREFVSGLVGTAAWPIATRAQQPSMPVIGVLGIGSQASETLRSAAFREGLSKAGLVEGRDISIEDRWAQNQPAKLHELASELVRRPVALIATVGASAALAAQAATKTIPIVFTIGGDPVKFGLVASLARPGGNLTGLSFLVNTLTAKRFEVLQEAVPLARVFGFLVNGNSPNTGPEEAEARKAVEAKGQRLIVASARSPDDLAHAVTFLVRQGVEAVSVQADQMLLLPPEPIVKLIGHHALPALYSSREVVAAGGLISYGTSQTDAYRFLGGYAARILRGEKPGDLPVQQSVKVELAVNLRTAKVLGLEIPPTLLARADEVIE